MSGLIYLDYQATTPTDERVVQAMMPYFVEKFGNPASSHLRGVEADLAVAKARRTIAGGLKASPQEIYFTSGASEANNLALKGIARAQGKGHIISVCTEHKCVLGALARLQADGFAITLLPVDVRGMVDPSRLEAEIRPDTVLVSVMYGNNETGSLHPLKQVCEITTRRGILLHCDATQAIGHVRMSPAELGIDLMTCSGHKIYGPKGIGILYAARSLTEDRRILPEIDGGGQEKGLRGGTLNAPAIIGLSRAFELLFESYDTEALRLRHLRRQFLDHLAERVGFVCNTPIEHALPHCVNLSFPGVNGQSLLQSLGDLALSTGSACNSGSQAPSHVLSAMGVAPDLISSSIRLSFGRLTTPDDSILAADRLASEVVACRK